MTALTGTFWSPYYPLDYKNHASCKWHITVPSNYTISVNFEDVTLERTCCRCDYVEVWETLKNGSAVLIATFCDDTKPDPSQQFRSTGNNVTIVFRSDATVQEKGFKASYRTIPLPVITTTSTIASTADSNDTRRTTTISRSSHVTTIPPTNSSTSSNVVTTQFTKQDDTTTVVKTTSTIAPTADSRETQKATTTSSHVATTPETKKNDTTTISFRNISTRTSTTERDTTARSSDLATETSTTEFTSKQRISPTELGKSTATNTDGVKEARNESASKGNVFVIVGVIACLIVIGGAAAGTLFWFWKKRIKRNHNNRNTLVVSFTSAEKAVDISNNSSWDMYQGSVEIDTVNESDNPLYERDCLENSAKDGLNGEIRESENPLYASSVETVKESDNPMYESMDNALKGTVQDDIYSLVYERYLLKF
ncbi:pheromone-regulated protein PRM7-like isoform X2 [Orbicella faveolata]|uniref:pheromone-regulated protein PRM7-like isoform X2 n=1 Tax=Orbicella faveolata TaxID=48498 RepID=UPI0009E1B762|nr:pheromone-regulated protein PRM7-like isoform X2 [Orbicella faveolata]